MKIAARILIVLVAVVSIAHLAFIAILSATRIVAVAELSTTEMIHALLSHCALPLCSVPLILAVAYVSWLATSFLSVAEVRGGQGVMPPDGIVKPNPPPPPPLKRDPVNTAATVITLREPNIDLSITLTGDAAKDNEGRRRIGEVTQWYASGVKNATAPSLADGDAQRFSKGVPLEA